MFKEKRNERYSKSQRTLVEKLREIGIEALIDVNHQSPIITTFCYPEKETFEFRKFYDILKSKGFVIYPGKLTDVDTFRIGNIGDVDYKDMTRLAEAIEKNRYW